MKMTSQNNLNKDFVKMFETLSQSINDLRKAVTFIDEELKRIDTLEQAFNREL